MFVRCSLIDVRCWRTTPCTRCFAASVIVLHWSGLRSLVVKSAWAVAELQSQCCPVALSHCRSVAVMRCYSATLLLRVALLMSCRRAVTGKVIQHGTVAVDRGLALYSGAGTSFFCSRFKSFVRFLFVSLGVSWPVLVSTQLLSHNLVCIHISEYTQPLQSIVERNLWRWRTFSEKLVRLESF